MKFQHINHKLYLYKDTTSGVTKFISQFEVVLPNDKSYYISNFDARSDKQEAAMASAIAHESLDDLAISFKLRTESQIDAVISATIAEKHNTTFYNVAHTRIVINQLRHEPSPRYSFQSRIFAGQAPHQWPSYEHRYIGIFDGMMGTLDVISEMYTPQRIDEYRTESLHAMRLAEKQPLPPTIPEIQMSKLSEAFKKLVSNPVPPPPQEQSNVLVEGQLLKIIINTNLKVKPTIDEVNNIFDAAYVASLGLLGLEEEDEEEDLEETEEVEDSDDHP